MHATHSSSKLSFECGRTGEKIEWNPPRKRGEYEFAYLSSSCHLPLYDKWFQAAQWEQRRVAAVHSSSLKQQSVDWLCSHTDSSSESLGRAALQLRTLKLCRLFWHPLRLKRLHWLWALLTPEKDGIQELLKILDYICIHLILIDC